MATGYSILKNNVYHGPDSSVYASVGNIGPLEAVTVLATSQGWYHIEYNVSGTSQKKTGYVPQSTLTNISGSITEEDFNGGYCYASNLLDVNTCSNFSLTAPVGKLGQYEGCTRLSSSNNISFIEYSTANGTKRGYVYSQYLVSPCQTIVCVANENITVYSGPSSSYAQLGSVFTGELVSLLAKEGNTAYVEYNTIGGRKRGYIDWTKLSPKNYTSGTAFADFYATTHANTKKNAWVTDRQTVYGGPNTTYTNTGVVNLEDIIDFDTKSGSHFPLTYIEYYITGSTQKKCGYINPSSISTDIPMEHNTLSELNNSYPYFGSKISYGTSQLNRPLFYYKAGTGSNHLFLVFAQHGWEDGLKTDGNYYHGDGNMLVRIARNFLERFSSDNEINPSVRNTILQNWKIYVFPCNNPDGIVNGYTINGFGRCLLNGVDPNRSWPANFPSNTATSTANDRRYYTTNKALSGAELQSLYTALRANRGSGSNVLIDTHGWLNQTIGSSQIASYYRGPLGITSVHEYNNYGNGFIVNWARQPIAIPSETDNVKAGLGADSLLIELPPTTDYSVNKIEGYYGSKFFQSTIQLLTV